MRKLVDTTRNIQPIESIPPEKPGKWMFYPGNEISRELGIPGINGAVPEIFFLAVRRPSGGEIVITYASIAYSRGWWCVGKETQELRYNIYFTPTGTRVFNGSLGECCRRMLLLPEYPEGFPLDPPLTLEEWYGTSEMVRTSQRWEEIENVLFKPKEIDHANL